MRQLNVEIKKIFNDTLCTNGHRHIGFICTIEEHKNWDNKYKDKRYTSGQSTGKLCSSDKIYFYVNTQWSKGAMEAIVKLAKSFGFKVKTTNEAPLLSLFD